MTPGSAATTPRSRSSNAREGCSRSTATGSVKRWWLSELASTLIDSRGDLTRAMQLLEAARLTFREIGDDVNFALAGDRLIHATAKGPARDALRTDVLAEVRAAGRVGIECSILHSWADELFTAGRYAEAYERATQTVSCFEKTTDLGRMGRALVSLGRLERVHGQLDKALANYTRALALQEQVKDEAAAVQSLNALATTFSMQGRHEEAKAHYELALARARILGRPDLINALAGNLGGFYLNWSEYEKAASLLEPALREEKQRLFISVRKRQLANAYQHLGRPDEAMKLVTEACDLAAEIGPEQLLHCVWSRAGIARLQGRLDQADRDLAQARRILEELRANTLPTDFMRRGFGQINQQLYGEVIDLLATRNDGITALAVSEEGRSRAFLDRLAARSDAGAKTTATTAAPVATATPATVADIKALAKRLQSTWLMYWVGDSDTLVWVVTPEGDVHWQRVPVTLAKIESLVAQSVPRGTALDGLAAVALGSRSHLRPWRELYQLLIKPVSAHLPTAPGSRLTIVPHGPLFRLSFAALPDEAGKYLLERYDLHYVPAAAVLQFTSAIPPRPALPSLLVGDPGASSGTNGATVKAVSATNGGTRDASLPELGWARREVASIGEAAARRERYAGRRRSDGNGRARAARGAPRDSFRDAWRGPQRSDAGVLSRHARSRRIRGGRRQADGGRDRRLLARRRSGRAERVRHGARADLRRRRAGLHARVPVSGRGQRDCDDVERGRSNELSGDGRLLSRVDRAGHGKARALRESQLAMLRELRKGGVTIDGVVLHESPWLWAGFVLVGNP